MDVLSEKCRRDKGLCAAASNPQPEIPISLPWPRLKMWLSCGKGVGKRHIRLPFLRSLSIRLLG